MKFLNVAAFCLLSIVLFACEDDVKETAQQQEKIDAVVGALMAEPRVQDVYYEDLVFYSQWNIGVLSNSDSEYGYASYICDVLSEKSLYTEKQVVRIVDINKVSKGGATPKLASLVRIKCDGYSEWPE